MNTETDEDVARGLLTRRLHGRFPTIELSVVRQVVADAYAGFEGCRIREFIPLLVERESRDRLREMRRPGENADAQDRLTVRPALQPQPDLARIPVPTPARGVPHPGDGLVDDRGEV